MFRTVPECEADALGTRQPDGTIVSCAPYLCDETTGACASDCAQDKDCAEGHVCRSAQCISAEDRPKVGLYDEDGCHCAQAGRGRDDRVAWLSSLLLLMLLRRRKRRPLRKSLALPALGVMALASSTVVLLGCTNPRKDLPPEEVCIDTGYSIANRIQACTGDNELATDVWNAFKDEYQCLVTKTDKTIEEYYVCPVRLRQTPCEIVEASVQGDLDDWLGTVPICTEVLAHTSGERIEPVVAADAGGGS